MAHNFIKKLNCNSLKKNTHKFIATLKNILEFGKENVNYTAL